MVHGLFPPVPEWLPAQSCDFAEPAEVVTELEERSAVGFGEANDPLNGLNAMVHEGHSRMGAGLGRSRNGGIAAQLGDGRLGNRLLGTGWGRRRFGEPTQRLDLPHLP